MAVVTNDYRLCGLKQHKFTTFQLWNQIHSLPEWADVRVAVCRLLEAAERALSPLPFPASGGAFLPGLEAPPPSTEPAA